ncbi:DegV family protein [Bacillus cereus]
MLKMNLKKNYQKVLHMFHANDKDGAEEWIADIRQAFPEMDFKLYPLPISFAVHAGEGTIAISY